MHNTWLFPVLAILFVLNPVVSAQSLLGINYPYGIAIEHESAFGWGTGGTSVSLPSKYSYFGKNPASLGYAKGLVYSTAAFLEYTRISEEANDVDYIRFHPHVIQFATPIWKLGIFSASFRRIVKSAVELVQESTELYNFEYEVRYASEISKRSLDIVWSKSPFKQLSIGITYKRSFLNISTQKSVSIEAYPSNREFKDAVAVENELEGGILTCFGPFSIGMIGAYAFPANMTLKHSSGYQVSTFRDTIKFKSPPSAGMGLSYELDSKLLLSVQITAEMWKFYDMPEEAGIPIAVRDIAVDGSLAAIFTPEVSLLKNPDLLRFKGGIRLSQLPKKNNGEIAFSAGVEIPIWLLGSIQWAIQYGIRSDTNLGNYSENFWYVALGYSGEVSFRMKPK